MVPPHRGNSSVFFFFFLSFQLFFLTISNYFFFRRDSSRSPDTDFVGVDVVEELAQGGDLVGVEAEVEVTPIQRFESAGENLLRRENDDVAQAEAR